MKKDFSTIKNPCSYSRGIAREYYLKGKTRQEAIKRCIRDGVARGTAIRQVGEYYKSKAKDNYKDRAKDNYKSKAKDNYKDRAKKTSKPKSNIYIDPFKILGINREATQKEIKKAYLKQASIHHPDKYFYLGERYFREAEERFKEIQQAYNRIRA